MEERVRNKTLAKIAKEIGAIPTVVLHYLILNFPDRMQLLDGKAVMKADKGAYLKIGMGSKLYYESIAALQGRGLINEIKTDDKQFFYQINWEKLDTYKPIEENVVYEIVD